MESVSSPSELLATAEAKLANFQNLFSKYTDQAPTSGQSPIDISSDEVGASVSRQSNARNQVSLTEAFSKSYSTTHKDSRVSYMNLQGETSVSALEIVELKLQLKAANATAEHLSAKVHVLQQHLSSQEHSKQHLKAEYHQRISQLLDKVQQQEETLGNLQERDQMNTEALRLARSAAASAAEQLNAKMQVLQADLAAQSQVEQRLKEEYQARILELQDKLRVQTDRVLVLEEQYIGVEEELNQLRLKEKTFTEQLQRLDQKGQRLEAERWEAMEAMSDMASTLVQFEKEKRELEHLRNEVHSQRKELESTRTSAQLQLLRQQQQISASSITKGELEGLLGQVSELQRGVETVERCLEARSMFQHGAALESSTRNKGTVGSMGYSAEVGLEQPGCSGGNSGMAIMVLSSPAFELVRTLRSLARSSSDLLTNYSTSVSSREGQGTVVEGVSSAEVVRMLREQHQLLVQLLLIVASELEGDAACLMQNEGKMVQLQKELDASRQTAVQMEVQLKGNREAEERCHRMGLEMKVVKTSFEAFKKRSGEENQEMARQNAVLRDQLLEKHRELQETLTISSKSRQEAEAKEKASIEVYSKLDGKHRTLVKQAKALGRKFTELQRVLEEQFNATKALTSRLQLAESALEGSSSDAESAVQQLQSALQQLARCREDNRVMLKEHEQQVQHMQEDSKLQLQLLMDAYTKELEAMHDQVSRLEDYQAKLLRQQQQREEEHDSELEQCRADMDLELRERHAELAALAAAAANAGAGKEVELARKLEDAYTEGGRLKLELQISRRQNSELKHSVTSLKKEMESLHYTSQLATQQLSNAASNSAMTLLQQKLLEAKEQREANALQVRSIQADLDHHRSERDLALAGQQDLRIHVQRLRQQIKLMQRESEQSRLDETRRLQDLEQTWQEKQQRLVMTYSKRLEQQQQQQQLIFEAQKEAEMVAASNKLELYSQGQQYTAGARTSSFKQGPREDSERRGRGSPNQPVPVQWCTAAPAEYREVGAAEGLLSPWPATVSSMDISEGGGGSLSQGDPELDVPTTDSEGGGGEGKPNIGPWSQGSEEEEEEEEEPKGFSNQAVGADSSGQKKEREAVEDRLGLQHAAVMSSDQPQQHAGLNYAVRPRFFELEVTIRSGPHNNMPNSSSNGLAASISGYGSGGGLQDEFSFGQQKDMKRGGDPWSPRLLSTADVQGNHGTTFLEEKEEEDDEREEVEEGMGTSVEYIGSGEDQVEEEDEEDGEHLDDDGVPYVREGVSSQDERVVQDAEGEGEGDGGGAYWDEEDSDNAADGLRRVPTEVRRHAELFAGDEGYARPSSAAPSSMRASCEPPVPEEVLDRARQHSGQEGGEGGRPGSAMPSSLRGVAATGGTWEAPVPEEVLQLAKQHSGQEGEVGGRPGSAVPSSLRGSTGASTSREAPVPEEVLQLAKQHSGQEGEVGGRPGSAVPSSLRGSTSARTSREAPVPEEVLQLAKQHSGQEGEVGGRPGSAVPSSLRAAADVPVPVRVQQYALHFAGGEGQGRPSSALPSSLRAASRGGSTVAIPGERLSGAHLRVVDFEGILNPNPNRSSSSGRFTESLDTTQRGDYYSHGSVRPQSSSEAERGTEPMMLAQGSRYMVLAEVEEDENDQLSYSQRMHPSAVYSGGEEEEEEDQLSYSQRMHPSVYSGGEEEDDAEREVDDDITSGAEDAVLSVGGAEADEVEGVSDLGFRSGAEDEMDEGFATGTERESTVSWLGGQHPSMGSVLSSNDDQEERWEIVHAGEGVHQAFEHALSSEPDIEVLGHMVISVRATERIVTEEDNLHP
ncbi:hypothetical protein CEUSTIGMA_g1764.t1 [Chlamydomonas eustigma]|uniref:Uncharacterized protein n=1 Tax=Chlamydomonas eustigma TaxID=1157962 RepID=A0A250WU40_9CHLO|nr:hypothetical protein CEUSTIGMA_g1764.t1 [Chlamydomonas eustigma]|eukprot:GAX74315.1 hypothetical protein CEUSTIGMA_g1764.t1 [Chlamydomonas eustigma]